MRLAYISQGNIPSHWAHTFQAMKQAEAFAQIADQFVLLTAEHPLARWYGNPFPFARWYGIDRQFEVKKLPVWGSPWRSLNKRVWAEGFERPAANFAANWNADLVFTRFPAAAIETLKRGIPTIIELHTPTTDAQFLFLLQALQHPLCLGVVTITQPLADLYQEAGVPFDKLLVQSDAVDQRLLDARYAGDRRRLEVPADAFVAMYCGHLYDEKGIPTVVEAARLSPEIHFLIVGGWEEDVSRWKRETSGMSNIRFTGFVPNSEIGEYFAISDLLLLPNSAQFPTAQWTSPLKLFEYMSAARPIAASRLPIFFEHLRDGENCLMFEPDNAASVTETIRRIRSDPCAATKLAHQARSDVAEYTWLNRAKRILNFARERQLPSNAAHSLT